MIKTVNLEKTLHFIGYWMNTDKKVISEILNPKFDFELNLIIPFTKELQHNLLIKDTTEGKTDLIKYYLFEFYGFYSFFKRYEDLINDGNLHQIDSKTYSKFNSDNTEIVLNNNENYAINCKEIYDIIFEEIQLCCFKYNIDFFEICHNLNFSLEYIDCGVSMIYEENKIANISSSKNKIISDNSFDIIGISSKKKKAAQLFESLLKGNHVDSQSRNDFIDAFTGHPPGKKINWTGQFGDLKTFINYLLEKAIINDVRSKWVITSNIFTYRETQFDSSTIKDTAITKNEDKIKHIINSL